MDVGPTRTRLGVAQTHMLAAAERVLVDQADGAVRTLLNYLRRALAPQGAWSAPPRSLPDRRSGVLEKAVFRLSARLEFLTMQVPPSLPPLPKEHPHAHHTRLPHPLVRWPPAA